MTRESSRARRGFARRALRRWRGKRKQSEIGELLGVGASAISQYEIGTRQPVADLRVAIERLTDGLIHRDSWDPEGPDHSARARKRERRTVPNAERLQAFYSFAVGFSLAHGRAPSVRDIIDEFRWNRTAVQRVMCDARNLGLIADRYIPAQHYYVVMRPTIPEIHGIATNPPAA